MSHRNAVSSENGDELQAGSGSPRVGRDAGGLERWEVCDLPEEPKHRAEVAECYNILRHYSKSLLEVRKLSLAQGLTVIAGAGLLYTQESFVFSLCVAAFGLAMSFFLHLAHNDYRRHWRCVKNHLLEVEGTCGLSVYTQLVKGMRDRDSWLWLAFHGPFILLYAATITLCVANLVRIV